MRTKLPAALTIDLNCIFPRWRCSVSDGKCTLNGGFLKRFRTHAEMWAWLTKHGYNAANRPTNV